MPTEPITQSASPRVRISGEQSVRATETRTATNRNSAISIQRSNQEPSPTASLSAFIAQKRAGRLETTPDRYKGHFVASWAGKCSPRRAIKAQCLECVGFDRREVAECTNWACALWHFRPFQKLSKVAAFDAAPSVKSKTSLADRQRDTAKLRNQ